MNLLLLTLLVGLLYFTWLIAFEGARRFLRDYMAYLDGMVWFSMPRSDKYWMKPPK